MLPVPCNNTARKAILSGAKCVILPEKYKKKAHE